MSSGNIPSAKFKSKSDDDIVIVAALRTPLSRSRKGAFAGFPASSLLQSVLEGVLKQTGVSGSDIDDICVGNCLLPAAGYGSLRMAQIVAGIPETTSLHTVNRQCSSGLQSISIIANAIRAGQIKIGIGAGLESMSQNPMNKMKMVPVDWDTMQQSRVAMDCLIPMGITSDTVVKEYGLERHILDEFAAESHRKAAAAQAAGKFDSEIVPVMTPNGLVQKDDGIRAGTTTHVLSKLKPAFTPSGPTTAGNSSQTTDGAAAVMLMTRGEARRRGIPILGVWHGFCTAGVPPRIMGIGPAVAIPKVLEQTGLNKEDIDVYEINEAFASQATWCIKELGLDEDKVNPLGGAIALGHPLGCTGARLIATLLPELRRRKGRFGVASMCVGTGMGAAAVVEVETHSSM